MEPTVVDAYLAGLDPQARATLEHVRRSIRRAVPDAGERLSYGLPAFEVRGKVVAGFGAVKTHLSYLPHSGSVIPALSEALAGYRSTKGSLHFAPDQPLSPELVEMLVNARLAELDP